MKLRRFGQRLAIEAFVRGSSMMFSAPTSSGNTLISEAAAVATVARGQRLFYNTPLKALSSQKFREFSSSNRRPGVRHSTFESLRLGLSSQSIASGFLRFWDSLNFKKDREFVGITVLFLDEKIP
uniref:DEAD/DEAH-box helicase domain-containing protein n=1 Tax=Brassica oleracea var. oleracea TaxID=109376 RepID=A0A0D3CZH5_BRAOL